MIAHNPYFSLPKSPLVRRIRQKIVSIAGHRLFYRLFAVRLTRLFYVVEISAGSESAAETLGADARVADSIFGALARNTVTPCALHGIIADFLAPSGG